LHHGHHARIAPRHRALEDVGPEQQRVARLGEINRRGERAFMLLPAFWTRVLEMHFLGRPLCSAALADHVVEHAERQFRILPALHDIGRLDAVFEPHEPILAPPQPQQRGFLMVVEQPHQVLQRGTEGGGGNRGIAPQPQVARVELVAEPQTESCPGP
jgi:hypothetical protein